MAILKYLPEVVLDDITMTVACTEGDPIAINSSGQGLLADATDATKTCVGFASRTVTSANITTGGDKAKVSLLPTFLETTTGLTPNTRFYLKASTTSGACTTSTRPSTAGNVIQPLGIALTATKRLWQSSVPYFVVQGAGTTTVAFG